MRAAVLREFGPPAASSSTGCRTPCWGRGQALVEVEVEG
jgi:hypothetical protein